MIRNSIDSSSNPAAGEPPLLRRLAPLAAALFVAIFGYLIGFLWLHEGRAKFSYMGDFRTFYQAAQFARSHTDIYLAGPNSSQMYVYPPLIAFAYTPFTWLPLLQAAHVSLVLNALMIATSVLMCCRIMLRRLDVCPPGAVIVAALIVTVLSETTIREELLMLETDAIMLLMFALALWWIDRRPFLSGVALALALNIKYLSIVALPWLILRRRWSAVAGMICGSVFFALLPATLLGWHENLRCLRVSLGGLLRWVGVPPEQSGAIKVHNIADNLSVSVTSALARVLQPHGVSNTGVLALTAAFGLLVLGLVWLLYRAEGFELFYWPKSGRQTIAPFKGLVGLEWAGLVVVALAFSPDTNTRHLVLTVMVNALAAAILISGRPTVPIAPTLVAVILIFVGYIMPLGQKAQPLHGFYFHYGIPGWCLLIGYLLILWNSLKLVQSQRTPLPRATDAPQSTALMKEPQP